MPYGRLSRLGVGFCERAAVWGKSAVNNETMSILVVIPVNSPACVNKMRRRFYGSVSQAQKQRMIEKAYQLLEHVHDEL